MLLLASSHPSHAPGNRVLTRCTLTPRGPSTRPWQALNSRHLFSLSARAALSPPRSEMVGSTCQPPGSLHLSLGLRPSACRAVAGVREALPVST